MSPNNKFGPKIAELMLKMCLEIQKETSANMVKLDSHFTFKNGRGDLNISSFISPDGKTERLLSPEVAMPRGTKLAHDAFFVLQKVAKKLRR